jgi:acetyltransferase-like isoleucine patch superfamily enzyme
MTPREKPLISFCITTHNRAGCLDKTLESLVIQSRFRDSDDIEIVVSDNNSTDETESVVRKYQELYGQRIIYVKRNETIVELHFKKALQGCRGVFRKLSTDWFIYRNGFLENLATLVSLAIEERPLIYFLNNPRSIEPKVEPCGSMDSFLERVSYMLTWNGGYGVWEDDFDKFADSVEYEKKQISIPYFVLKQLESSPASLIYDANFAHPLPEMRKGPYNLAEVFCKNYMDLVNSFRESGLISERIFNIEKKRVFEEVFLTHYFSPNHNFYGAGYREFLCYYDSESYVESGLRCGYITYARTRDRMAERLQTIKSVEDLRLVWRDLNPQNDTIMQRPFNPQVVLVGRYSYGPLNVYTWGAENEGLIIGNFVSIADDVTFLLGGNHDHQRFTTCPVKVKFYGHQLEAESKGPIFVGDDVWLAHGTTILSGVSIGQGAVVAAGAVVTRDIPPYAIAAGNPAKVIKFRFSDMVIKQLIRIDFANLTPETFQRIGEELATLHVTDSNVDQIISKLVKH